MIDAVLRDPASSRRVARTFEFRKKLNELPHEVRTRVDGRLDEFFRSVPAHPETSLSAMEEQTVAYERIAQLVAGRIQLHYEAGQINEPMFHVLCNLISENFTAHAYDPSNY